GVVSRPFLEPPDPVALSWHIDLDIQPRAGVTPARPTVVFDVVSRGVGRKRLAREGDLKSKAVEGGCINHISSVVRLADPVRRLRRTDRVGFEPTVPLRAHRFSRPAVSTAHAPVQTAGRLDVQTPRRLGHAPLRTRPWTPLGQ